MEAAVNVKDASVVCDLLKRAAELNLAHPARRGSVINLKDQGTLLVTGDLHDNTNNLRKMLKLAALDKDADHHLILQELIHGEHLINNMDFSYRTLCKVAELKIKYPKQVHPLLANHELAQVRGEGILKDSISVVEAFNEGLAWVFGDDTPAVADAIKVFVESFPLAVRTDTGIMCSHSLPAVHKRETFDATILDRVPTEADRTPPDGSAYLMVWGRWITQVWVEDLADRWGGIEQFVIGHQHAEMGYEEIGTNVLVINSDHSHGCVLPIDLTRHYSRDELIEQIIPLAGVL